MTDESALVIIVNYKQIDYTVKCVKSVLESDYSSLSVVVLDNGASSLENSTLKLQLPEQVEVIHFAENIGYVNAVNHGLKIAAERSIPYIAIMNNDTIIDAKAISALIGCAKKHDNNCIVSGKVYHYDRKNTLQHIGSDRIGKGLQFKKRVNDADDVGQYDQEIEFDLLDDILWLIPRKVFIAVGFYNPVFWFNAEQADYALRARNLGYKLIYTPDSKIWHKGSISIGGRSNNPVLVYWNTQSTLLLKFLHNNRLDFYRAFLLEIAQSIFYYLIYILRRIFMNRVKSRVLEARLRAELYMVKWLFKKNDNNGYNPYLKVTGSNGNL